MVDSLKASLWCLGTTETFEGAALKAVNLGNDTDTIGGITGACLELSINWKVFQINGDNNW